VGHGDSNLLTLADCIGWNYGIDPKLHEFAEVVHDHCTLQYGSLYPITQTTLDRTVL
jgi:hypothetical protein